MLNWLERVYGSGAKLSDESFRPSSVCGEPLKRTRMLVDHDGVKSLETTGTTDLYAYIQSHKDSVDINKILERYRAGDVNALDRRTAQYLDLENAPKSLAEMYSFVQNASTFFSGLPLDVREAYDHNPAAFVADIGSEKWNKLFKLGDDKKVVDPGVDKKVVDSGVDKKVVDSGKEESKNA